MRDIESPPGGWRLTVPQTGVTLTAPYAKSLKVKVRKHLDANDHEEPDDFDEWFDNAVCEESGHGDPFCGDPAAPVTEQQKFITPSKAKRFLRTILALLQERKLVDRAEAERRAAICAQCPLAGHIGSCWGCYAIYRKIRRMLKGAPIDMDSQKRWCLACGCYLPGKLWLTNEGLDKAEAGDRPDYAARCWRRESEVNSSPSAP
jgi:hypothetical protein